MNLPRRDFLKTTLAASATAALGAPLRAGSGNDFLRRRILRAALLPPQGRHPAQGRRQPRPARRHLEVRSSPRSGTLTSRISASSPSSTSTRRPRPPRRARLAVWVLIPHPSLVVHGGHVALRFSPPYPGPAPIISNPPKASPAFERIDSWLLLAFAGMPGSRSCPPSAGPGADPGVPEMRDYEGHSELKALNKMAMFNDGEIQLMKDLGMNPVFYGQALAGPDLPHLRYIDGPDLATLAGWKKFELIRAGKKCASTRVTTTTPRGTSRFLARSRILRFEPRCIGRAQLDSRGAADLTAYSRRDSASRLASLRRRRAGHGALARPEHDVCSRAPSARAAGRASSPCRAW